jgi:hypothetical protein
MAAKSPAEISVAAANANGSKPSGEEVTKFGARSQLITARFAESNDVFWIIWTRIRGQAIFLCELISHKVPAGSGRCKCREHEQ